MRSVSMSRVVAANATPYKISITWSDRTIWEYTRGEVSYTEWISNKPYDWFIPNELDFLNKINRYLEEAIQYKNTVINVNAAYSLPVTASYVDSITDVGKPIVLDKNGKIPHYIDTICEAPIETLQKRWNKENL